MIETAIASLIFALVGAIIIVIVVGMMTAVLMLIEWWGQRK